ncbi:hypothetical protein DAMA08_043650 [Martiniozyma asiatica (nom. inval.)]|nr:hypothetical protein DAMA08_043650 [Martiniozyma asiatica]
MDLSKRLRARAEQVKQVQPVVAFNCMLYAAQLLMENGAPDDEIDAFLSAIELYKSELVSQSDKFSATLKDADKCFGLVLAFATKVFNSAFDHIQSHTSSKTTVLDFKAAIDFFEVLNLWQDMYDGKREDVQRMIKYSKFHAARIWRALKEGQDPNDYIDPEEEKELELELSGVATVDTENANQEEGLPNLLPDAPTEISTEPPQFVSKSLSSDVDLPEAPEQIAGELNLPTAPVLIKGQNNSLGLPSAPEDQSDHSQKKTMLTPTNATIHEKPPLPPQPKLVSTPLPTRKTSLSSGVMSREQVEQIWKKDEIIAKAQKKAKFAISALNYEDIETAIKELSDALQLLKGD